MLYQILRLIGKPIIYLLFLPKIIGKKNTRHKGRAIIISNHISMWDPLFIAVVFRRQIFWMGKIELFKNKLARIFFYAVKAFPVRRGEGDLAAIRHAFKILRSGKLFGIFPEGTRGSGGEVAPFRAGLHFLARQRPDVDLVPVKLHNLGRIMPKGEFAPVPQLSRVTFGEPLRLEPRESKDAFLERARQALVSLDPESP